MIKSPPNCIILPRYSLTFKHSTKPMTFEVAGLRYEKKDIILVKCKKRNPSIFLSSFAEEHLDFLEKFSHTQLTTMFLIKLNSSALEEFHTATLALHLCKTYFNYILRPWLSPNPSQYQRLTLFSASCLSFCIAPYSSAYLCLSSFWYFFPWWLGNVLLNASTCISWAQTGQADRPKAQLGLRLTFRTAVASAPGSDARCSGPFEGDSFPFAPSEDGVCQEPASLPPSLPTPGQEQPSPGAAARAPASSETDGPPHQNMNCISGEMKCFGGSAFSQRDLELQVSLALSEELGASGPRLNATVVAPVLRQPGYYAPAFTNSLRHLLLEEA